MITRAFPLGRPIPQLPLVLMIILLVTLWISGGASRADAIGQVIARGACWSVLLVFVLACEMPKLRSLAAVGSFVAASVVLVILQLIPLPPSMWSALPGRQLFEEAAIVSGQAPSWRPLSISPSATQNALSSLIVPVVTFLVMASIKPEQLWRVAGWLLGLMAISTLIGLLQFSGGRFDHPLINDVTGMVSANFANRNHFALFAAIGCLLTPVWAFQHGGRARWRGPVGIGLEILLGLIVLATGSRMGMLTGLIGTVFGLLIVRDRMAAELRRLNPMVSFGIIGAIIAATVMIITLSILTGRAASVERAMSMAVDEDLRRQTLPTVLAMISLYFPFGAGAGTFDAAYRISELDRLLSIFYFNHAHNDVLEIILENGLPGATLLTAVVVWWIWRSFVVWKPRIDSSAPRLAQAGSGILLLTLLASITDYPARTPMIMAIIVIAAVWLSGYDLRDENEKPSSGRDRKGHGAPA